MNPRPQHSARSFRRGFTLIEVLVTMALMGIVLPIVLQSMSSSSLAASYARHAAEAATLGQTKLNEVTALLISGQTDTGAGSGDFGPGWPGYTYQCEQTYDSDLLLTVVNLKVMWTSRGQERSILLSTLVADTTAITEAAAQ